MELEEALINRLNRLDEVRFALLFGSQSEHRSRADSDWDLGIYLAEHLTGQQRFKLHVRLQATLSDLGPVDVVVLNDAPPLLAQRALQGQRLLVKDKVAFVRFFVRSEARAGDERFWRQLHMDARARRLRERTFGRP